MTRLEVLQMLIKSESAGVTYFVADYQTEDATRKIKICGANALYAIDTLDMSYSFKWLTGPRLPERRISYMEMIDREGEYVSALFQSTPWSGAHSLIRTKWGRFSDGYGNSYDFTPEQIKGEWIVLK